MPTEITPSDSYSRQDVLRILRLHPRQLAGWERAGLSAVKESYSFEDLVRLRRLRDLSASRISSRSIRAGIDAMRRVSGMTNPLVEAGSIARRGSRLVFRHSGALVDPVAQQLLFDFDPQTSRPLAVVHVHEAAIDKAMHVQEMFLQAVQLEEHAATIGQAQQIYLDLLELDSNHAPSCINLGTIYYNQKLYGRAEQLYRRATIADPSYALAFFDLGNVLDELQRLPEAIEAYKRAVALSPSYADAHYNLALTYERCAERRRALPHWLSYVRLDPIGPWATHARSQARRILAGEKLSIVKRHASK